MDTSVYSHALEVWSKADLANLQRELDTNVIQVKDKENESLESRKVLATETKQFKKLDETEKLSNINKIIKKYQQEVDSLTKRSKFAEQIVFDVYSKLSEAPDPKPLLQSSLDKLSKVDDSKMLSEKVTELEDKLAKYADYESIKSRLLDLEQNSAVTLSKRLAAKEHELTSSWEEKQRNWQEREVELNKQVESLQNTNKALETKISKQVNIENSDDTDTDTTANKKSVSLTEYNFITEELESTQARVFQLEKRNETLSGDLAKATSANEKETELKNKELKINQLQSENALLSASIEKNHNSHERSIKNLNEELANIKTELNTYKSENDTIRLKLNNYSDYNKIKEELTSLKKIEFGIDDDDEDIERVTESYSTTDKNLQNTLISTNKKLQSNLAELRTKNIDYEDETKKLKKEIAEMNGKVDSLQKLNAKLEADLEKIDDIDGKFNDTTSMISGVTRKITNRGGHGASLSPTSSIIGIPEEEELQSGNIGGNSQILPIVTKQRDRFRARNTDLEKQVRQIMAEKAKLQSEKSKLQNDNNKLYEKVRYLSSYDGSSRHSSIVDTEMENIDSEAQYSNSYEASLHPLANFKRDELEYYKKNKLSVFEKLFISFANLILQNKTTRMAFFFYCIGLHGLIFMMCMYVANLSGYMTPEVAIVKTSSSHASP